MATGEEEAAALDTVLTRLVSTPDEQLEKLLVRLLPVVIQKLGLGHPAVQQKVLAILSHLNKRLKPLPAVRLPLHELVVLYTDGHAALMTRNFAIVYVERACARAEPTAVAHELAFLLPGLATRPKEHQSILFKCLLSALPAFADCKPEIPGQTSEKSSSLPSPLGLESPQDRSLLLCFARQLVSYQRAQARVESTRLGVSSAIASMLDSVEILSKPSSSYSGVQDPLTTAKLGMLGLLVHMGTQDDLFPCVILAASGGSDIVAARGELLLRAVQAQRAVEDAIVVRVLLDVALGVDGWPVFGRVPPVTGQSLVRVLGALARSRSMAQREPTRAFALAEEILSDGLTQRERLAGAELASWVLQETGTENVKELAPRALDVCLAVVLSQAGPQGPDAASARGALLRALATIARRVPEVLRGRTDIAAALLEALGREAAGTRALLQETLGSVAPAFKGAPGLLDLIAVSLRSTSEPVRATALTWVVQLLDEQDPEAQYLAILAANDASDQISSAARRFLEIGKDLPRFGAMLTCMLQHHPDLGVLTRSGETSMEAKSLAAAIHFLERIREASPAEIQADLAGQAAQYAALLIAALTPQVSTALVQQALLALLTTVRAASKSFQASDQSLLVKALLPFVYHPDRAVRARTARTLGLLRGAVGSEEHTVWSRVLSAPTGRLEERLGAGEALGCALCWRVYDSQADGPSDGELALRTQALEGMDELKAAVIGWLSLLELARGPGKDRWFQQHEAQLVSLLSSNRLKIQVAAIRSLGFLGWASSVPDTWDAAAEKLLELSAQKDNAVASAAGEALCLTFSGPELGLTVEDVLVTDWNGLQGWKEVHPGSLIVQRSGLEKASEQDDEVHQEQQLRPVQMAVDSKDQDRSPVQSKILEAILDKHLGSTRKEQRAAGTIWLLCLLQFVGTRSATLTTKLTACQEALIPLLRDDSELIQELASQGLILVHGLAQTAEEREELAKQLIIVLTGNATKRPAAALSGATDAANGTGTAVAAGVPGMLSGRPMAGAFPVYRELAGIANSIGQPQLLYDFMRLALQTGTKKSPLVSREVQGQLEKQTLSSLMPRFLPRLYRLRFDPDPKVQRAMTNTWLLLVDDSSATLSEQFVSIMGSLLMDITTNSSWRVRESGALAAADLVRGRAWSVLGQFYGPLWTGALRLLDDIQQSVRVAALSLIAALRSWGMNALETWTPESEGRGAVLREALPPLLKALGSPAGEVRITALTCLGSFATKSPAVLLRPLIPELAPALLEALSGLEDARLNYVEQHAASMGLNTDRLDELRVKAAHAGPLGDALDACSAAVDGPTLAELVKPVLAVARKGVGAATRAGAARFLSTVIRRAGPEARDAVSAALTPLLEAARRERAAEARRALASAAAAVLRSGAVNRGRVSRALEALIAEDRQDASTSSIHSSAAFVLERLAIEAPEALAKHAPVLAPVAYLGQRSGNESSTQRAWQTVWDAATSATGAPLRHYAAEICAACTARLEAPGWEDKSAAARALHDAATASPDALAAHSVPLLRQILAQIPGRLWEGKETLVAATPPLLRSSLLRSNDAQLATSTVSSLATAATRKKNIDTTFRSAALRALCEALDVIDTSGLGEGPALAVLEQLLPAPLADAPQNNSNSSRPHDDTAALSEFIPCLVQLRRQLPSRPAERERVLCALREIALPTTSQEIEALSQLAAAGEVDTALACLLQFKSVKAHGAELLKVLESVKDQTARVRELARRIAEETNDREIKSRAAALLL